MPLISLEAARASGYIEGYGVFFHPSEYMYDTEHRGFVHRNRPQSPRSVMSDLQ